MSSPTLKNMHCPQCMEKKNKRKDRKTSLVLCGRGGWKVNGESDLSEILVQLVLHPPLAMIKVLLMTF